LELRDSEGTLLGPPLTIEQSEHIDPRTLQLHATAYEGFCERQVDGRLEGWAWNVCIPQLPVILEIQRDGEVVDFVRADRFRLDLVDAGKRNGSCGFSVALPIPPLGALNPEVTLRIAGTGFQLQYLTLMKDPVQVLSPHVTAGEQAHVIEQQLLSMGGGHPNVAQSETPGGAVMQHATERALALTALESRLHDALGAQKSRLDRQEAILAAVKGTVDNLVRTWLQVRNDIALLRADFEALHTSKKMTERDGPSVHEDFSAEKSSLLDRTAMDNVIHSQSTALAGQHSPAVPAPNATTQMATGIVKPPEQQQSINSRRKRKVGPAVQRRKTT
jgi:hypothetical protein